MLTESVTENTNHYEKTIKTPRPPAEPLRDELQVVVSGHELSEARQFANAWWNSIKVQLVRVHVQFLQLGQLTDSRLAGDT